MIQIRSSSERGHFNFGWLDTYHTFSFGEYHDPAHMGFRTLRVINEDIIAPGRGFPMHSHRDMEIVTYILEGELAHKDSMGNEETIKRGELQRMSAGTGIQHSEYNASKTKPCHLLQIWIIPEEKNLKPGYEQKTIGPAAEPLQLIAAHPSLEAPLRIHQNAAIYAGRLKSGQKTEFELSEHRFAWIQIARGSLQINRKKMDRGDGAAVSNETELFLQASEDCEFLIFDLN